MKKFKININRSPVTDKEIEGYKDFETLMNKYNDGKSKLQKLNIRNIIISSFAGVAAVIVILVAYYSMPASYTTISNPGFPQREAFVKPPVREWDIPFKSVFISVQNDTVVQIQTSFIRFPKNCLEDNEGNSVTTDIEVRYREFPTPAEIFLSGIPMVYDSAGVRSTFESAGMIEIYAFSKNKPLRIKEGSNVEVSLISASAETSYNLYYLDTVKRNWTYQGKETVTIKKAKPSILAKHNRKIISDSIDSPIVPIKPEPPQLANKNKWQLELDLAKGEFPEFDAFKKTTFEIDESYKIFNKKHAQIEWEDVTLKQGPRPMSYYIQFKKGKDSCQYLVKPVLTGKEYNVAKARYDSLYGAYSKSLALRKENERKRAIADSVRFLRTIESFTTTNIITRSFTIQNFGIWNSDRIRRIPNEETLNPILVVNDTIYNQTSYLADATSNSLSTYYPGNVIRYNKKAKNLLWMVTYNNIPAVFTENDFKNLPAGTGKNRLNMRVIKTPVNSSEDFIKLYKRGFIE